MTTNNNQNNDFLFSEAPASWNTRYVDPTGFECQFTLRAENGQELLEKANSAIAYLSRTIASRIHTGATIVQMTTRNYLIIPLGAPFTIARCDVGKRKDKYGTATKPSMAGAMGNFHD